MGLGLGLGLSLRLGQSKQVRLVRALSNGKYGKQKVAGGRHYFMEQPLQVAQPIACFLYIMKIWLGKTE